MTKDLEIQNNGTVNASGLAINKPENREKVSIPRQKTVRIDSYNDEDLRLALEDGWIVKYSFSFENDTHGIVQFILER